jgi:hypothetical protein
MINQYVKGQHVKILCYDYKTRENEWKDALVLNVIPATDRPFRIELALTNGVELKGYDAAAPECVKLFENK